MLCRRLKCSRNGYYAWLRLGRPLYKAFKEEIDQLVMMNYHYDPRQGIRRLRMNIKAVYGISLTNATIYRVMRLNSVQSIIRKKRKKYGEIAHHQIPNLLQRDFTTTAPNQKWSIDVSYLNTTKYRLYLCAIKDLYDKSIRAYSISRYNDNRLVFDSLNQALYDYDNSQSESLILHSDQGAQFTSTPYRLRLEKDCIQHSVSYKGSCADNVPIESWFSALKSESVYLHHKITPERMIELVSDYIRFYNEHRLQEQLKELTPIQYRKLALR